MNRLVNGLITGFVICLFWSSALVVAQPETGKLLDELNLGNAQRAEINAVLTGGMQSLNAINTELLKLENLAATATESRPQYQQMRTNLIEQRFRLVQSMASDILSVLDDKQLSKLDFGHLIETLPKNPDNSTSGELEL
ncbi:MAG: hypothetical protein RL120_12995 [Gammaproteobacteria bacterium]